VGAQKLSNGASGKENSVIDAQNVEYFSFGQINRFKSQIDLSGLRSGL
jgi:hypothetical protein